jgi:mono/diheme cytochrome c family protein
LKFFLIFCILFNYLFFLSNTFSNDYSDDYFKKMNSIYIKNNSSIEEGKSKYSINCISCHGPKGKGGRAPTLISNGFAPGGVYKNEFFFFTIKYGREGTIMGSFDSILSDIDIYHIISYLRNEANKITD